MNKNNGSSIHRGCEVTASSAGAPANRSHHTALHAGLLHATGVPSGNLLHHCSLLAAAFTGLLVAGCEAPKAPPAASPPPSAAGQVIPGPVILGEGDVVKFFYPGAVEYNNSQKIRTDGKITLPLLGEIQAAGKSLNRLQSELSAQYKTQLQNSEVVISLEASGKPVIISGAVATPGKFVFDRPTTLLEAIMGAGGFTDFARKGKVRVIRLVNGHYQTETYDLSKGLTGGEIPFVYVKGGDMIHIPQSNW